MVDQHRSQASVQQPKYDTYAKPVLLSQPEKQRTSIHVSSESPDSAAAEDHGARKVTPGKLDLSKLRSLSQGDIKATPGPAGALRAPRKTPPDPSSGSGADVDNAGKENLLSPGRLVDLPNGTPLSRHPSDALSRKASPKALLDGDGGASQGQITIAVAQYEQKILQGQRLRKGRFSGASTPDVSRHNSVCSSEHATPRETPQQPSGVPFTAAEPRSNGSAPRSSVAPEAGTAAEAGGPVSGRQSPALQPEALPQRTEVEDARQGGAIAAKPEGGAIEETSTIADVRSISEEAPALEEDGSCLDGGEAPASAAEQSQDANLDRDSGSASAPSPAASAGDAAEPMHAADSHSAPCEDVHVLPVSTCASPGPAAEPEPRCRPHAGATAAGDPAGPAAIPPAIAESASKAAASSQGAGEAGQAVDGADSSGSTALREQATPSSAQTGREIDSNSNLSAESVREPEWVAAFRRVVSLAVNTPLSQEPAPMSRSVASSDTARQIDAVLGPSEPAPSPSSEVGRSADARRSGGDGLFSRGGIGGGRNLDTAFESALTDSRRKRLRADASAHGSGSVVRAAAAVQRAAERATLDRNDYSGARISQEASSVLSPGAIALVNGRTAHSSAELQAQLSDVVHQLRFCLASMSEQQRPLLHATEILQAAKVPRRDLAEAAEKLQEAERLRRWSEVAQSENIARLLGILGEMQAVQQARAEEVHFSAHVWLKLLGSSPPQNDSGRLRRC